MLKINPKGRKMLTKLAAKFLIWKLRSDKNLWLEYRNDIATMIQNSIGEYFPYIRKDSCILGRFSDACANKFFELWIKQISNFDK